MTEETPRTPLSSSQQNGLQQNHSQQRGSKQRRAWIIATLIAVLFTVGVAWYVIAQAQADRPDTAGTAGGTAEATADAEGTSPDGTDSDGTETVTSPTDWPRNMATGGVVFSGADAAQPQVVESPAQPAGSSLPVAPTSNVDRVVVYFDYRCPYCAEFERVNNDLLHSLATSQGIEVEIRPLTFLDRVGSDEYSSRTAGALACVTDAEPEFAWSAHQALIDSQFQPGEGGTSHDDAAIIDAIDREIGGAGLSTEARSCIEEGAFVPFVQFRNDWTSTHTVPDAIAPDVAVTGTPLVLVNGVVYTGDPTDADAFAAFVAAQGVEAR